MTNNKGITLIALVITIIVLLILAGVSIAMLTGNNGILTQAGNAKTDTAKAEAEEALKLAVSEILANKYDPTYNPGEGTDESVINQANLKTLTEKNNSNVTATVSTEAGTTVKYFPVKLESNGEEVNLYVTTSTGEITTEAPAQS